jgi:hypothetical protein
MYCKMFRHTVATTLMNLMVNLLLGYLCAYLSKTAVTYATPATMTSKEADETQEYESFLSVHNGSSRGWANLFHFHIGASWVVGGLCEDDQWSATTAIF